MLFDCWLKRRISQKTRQRSHRELIAQCRYLISHRGWKNVSRPVHGQNKDIVIVSHLNLQLSSNARKLAGHICLNLAPVIVLCDQEPSAIVQIDGHRHGASIPDMNDDRHPSILLGEHPMRAIVIVSDEALTAVDHVFDFGPSVGQAITRRPVLGQNSRWHQNSYS
jgi:hypothetical protein